MTDDNAALRVLGVDPGTRVAGFGVLDVVPGRDPVVVECGGLRLKGRELPDRLLELHDGLAAVIARHSPSILAVETVFHGKSFDSVLKVGEARGVVLLVGAANGLEIHQYAPALVKKTTTGNGRASKQQVQRMIVRLLGLDHTPEPVDATDALAIAFCYARRLWRRGVEPRPDTPLRAALSELRSKNKKPKKKRNPSRGTI